MPTTEPYETVWIFVWLRIGIRQQLTHRKNSRGDRVTMNSKLYNFGDKQSRGALKTCSPSS